MNKFDKTFLESALQYRAPLTKDLETITEGIRSSLRKAIAEPYNRASDWSDRMNRMAQSQPDQAWLELLFGRRPKQDLLKKIKQAQKQGKKEVEHGGKRWDLNKKEIQDLINTMSKKQSHEPVGHREIEPSRSTPSVIRPPREKQIKSYKPPRATKPLNIKPPR
jgi:hypothetical protein